MIADERQYMAAFREARRLEHALRRRPVPEWAAQVARTRHEWLVEDLAAYDAEHAADRRGEWMTTFSGRRFWLMDPRPGDIDIEDIAQGLSRLSRYFGGTLGRHGYTVAQHSVLASWIVGQPARLAALLHDAPEAYAGDVITPLKKLLGDAYRRIEAAIMAAVAGRFGLTLSEEVVREVEWADRVMLATEVRDLVPLHALRFEPAEGPMPCRIEPWTQEQSKRAFLRRFEELTYGQQA
jgi:5'-deoxynucleotidase YfbR-like HD superfamily hydrolase